MNRERMNEERKIARDKAKLEAARIPEVMLSFVGPKVVMSKEKKRIILDNQERAKALARRLDTLRRDILDLEPYLGIDLGVAALYKTVDWGVPYDTEPLKDMAESLRKQADVLGQCLRNHGRADLTLDLFVDWVFQTDSLREKPFRAWGSLARVLGVDDKKLKRRVEAIRKVRDSTNSKGDSHGSNGKSSRTSHS